MLNRTVKVKITLMGLMLVWVFSQSTYTVNAAANSYYKVGKGDTLYQIAGEAGVTVQELIQVNQIEDPKLLQIGYKLKIPKPLSVPAEIYVNTYTNRYDNKYANKYAYRYASKNVINIQEKQQTEQSIDYKVMAGDTLYEIAISYGTTLESLILSNRIGNPNLLQIGQRLKIPLADAVTTQAMGGEEYDIDKVLNATLTAYTAGVESTGKAPDHPQYGITFSGKKVQEGRTIAVDPSVIALGTNVYIEGIGLRTAEDIGSAIKGSKIDVYIENLDEALEFGVKKDVKVYVLSN